MTYTLSIIGAGSNYTPVIIDSILNQFDIFPFEHIKLMDISHERLSVVSNFIEFQLKQRNVLTRINTYETLRPALEDSDLVITIYRVGGSAARHFDTVQASRLNVLGQETQGWGGFASALRNIPLAIEISDLLAEISPNAWLLNITNPVGIITQACNKVRPQKSVGICEIPTRMLLAISKALNLEPTEMEFSYVGLNHLSWFTDISVHGESVISSILNKKIEAIFNDVLVPKIPDSRPIVEIAKSIHAIPSPYLLYYYLTDLMINQIRTSQKTRAEICIEIDTSLMNSYSRLDPLSWQTEAKRRGGYLLGPTVSKLINQLLYPSQERVIPCIPNNNTLPFISPHAVIETPIKMLPNKWSSYSVDTLAELHPHIRGLISQVAAYEELTVEAGIKGDYKAALAALISHPLIPSSSVAKKLLDETLAENSNYLPQFK